VAVVTRQMGNTVDDSIFGEQHHLSGSA